MAVKDNKLLPISPDDMTRRIKTKIGITYRWNGKNEPERLNRVYDMLISRVIKNVYEYEKRSKEVRPQV